MKHYLGSAAFLVLICPHAAYGNALGGDYICTVPQKAGIEAVHVEGAASPRAFVAGDPATRFAIRITAPTTKDRQYRIVESPYSGPDRDRREYQTPNSVLHGAYVSNDGEAFTAVEDQAFLRVGSRTNRAIWFYHAGFEYPGGEDTNLSVRWGTCVLKQ
jgi:hypothetical protein